MRLSLSAGIVLGVVALSGLSGRATAAPISLANSGENQSAVSATAGDDALGPTVTNDVNSLPFTTPTSTTFGQSSSEVDSNLTTSALNFSFTQDLEDTDAPSSADGNGDIFFKAGSNVTYSIAGTMTVSGIFVEGELITSLYDQTTGTYLYNYDQTTGVSLPVATPAIPGFSSTLNLDSSGGSLTGSLTAGDTYEFYADENVGDFFADPGLSGNSGISFNQSSPVGPGGSSAPLPSAALSGLIALAGFGVVLGRRGKMSVA